MPQQILDCEILIHSLYSLPPGPNLNNRKIPAFTQMSISLEAVFGAIAILVALPPAVVIVMRSMARRRRQHILPLVQAHQGELFGKRTTLQGPRLIPSTIQASKSICRCFHLLFVLSQKWKCCSMPTGDLIRKQTAISHFNHADNRWVGLSFMIWRERMMAKERNSIQWFNSLDLA